MSPSVVTIDNTPDLDFGGNFNPTTAANAAPSLSQGQGHANSRTLLLAPPSVASQGDLTAVIPSYDRSTTDLHMLDRLSAGLVTLPPATYDLVLLLTDADGARHAEAASLLSRDVLAALVPAMRAGGKLRTQDGRLGEREVREAVLAGLVERDGGFEKVEEEEVVIPLRFGKKKNNISSSSNGNTTTEQQQQKMEEAAPPAVKAMPAGVGFDFGDDLDDDDELIDEDELMTEEDLNRPIQIRTLPRPPYPRPSFHVFPHADPPSSIHSPRVCPPTRQEAPRMQGLHLRPGRAPRGRGQDAPRQGGQGARRSEVEERGSERAGLHRAGQDGQLRQLRAGRCLPVFRLPLHRPAPLQARRGGDDPEQRCPVLSGVLRMAFFC